LTVLVQCTVRPILYCDITFAERNYAAFHLQINSSLLEWQLCSGYQCMFIPQFLSISKHVSALNIGRQLSSGMLSWKYQLKMSSWTWYCVALVWTNVSANVSSIHFPKRRFRLVLHDTKSEKTSLMSQHSSHSLVNEHVWLSVHMDLHIVYKCFIFVQIKDELLLMLVNWSILKL
jgi:hypothetical protein